ncbi:TniQ family protein [Blautia sp. MSJ-36]|uniref:TniQ family protein n=1 Tax=Blautia sp. MSJ-36 TaxID=2841530 RepID=UPI001C11F0F7|nr:TniQ family protein [Blautia sp. MSJ-36]MBU5446331.1 TniQ family protein [Blautia sp. MSJ-36]
MIGFMPELYPDELVYSLFSRYHSRSGNLLYRASAEEIFKDPLVRPDIEFINRYREEVVDILRVPVETLVKKHTMFPAYGIFLPYERRKAAFCSLVQMGGKHQNLLAIPKGKEKRRLRFCPVCVKKDRERYGETYWHRTWQIGAVRICSEHKCYLEDTDVFVSGKATPAFLTAEESIPENQEVRYCGDKMEIRLSQYITNVFQTEIDMDNDVSVGEFLHTQMEGTKYLSLRGEQRNIGLLHQDFMRYYQELQENDFTELWQIQKVFTNDRYRIQDVSMLGMFLGIEPDKLVNRKLPLIRQTELFEKEIYRLHKKGMKYPEIAKSLGASYDTVKSIGERRYKKVGQKQNVSSVKAGVKSKNWEEIDRKILPAVKQTIEELWENKERDGRPGRITVNAVEKKLGIPAKQIEKLQLCKKEIQKHQESYPRFWAREVVWAVQQIQGRDDVVNWKKVRGLTNLRKKNFLSCIPYLETQTDPATTALIKSLL